MQQEYAQAATIPLDWRAVAAEFRVREFATLQQATAALPGVDVPALWDLFDADVSDEQWRETSEPVIRAAFAAAADVPGGLPVLAAYLYVLCQKRWEHSIAHATILRVATAAAAAFDESHGDAEGPDERLARLLLQLGVSLDHCMAAENALNCSCPTDMRRHAVAAAAAGDTIYRECAAQQAIGEVRVADFVALAASAQAEYFGALGQMAQAVAAFLERRQDSERTLRAAIAALARAERSDALRGDVYESELRAHRLTLETMRTLTTTPELRVDDGRISYCYPFAVLGISTEEIYTRLRAVAPGTRLGRATVTDMGELDVSDAWGEGDAEGRAYGGVKLSLGDLAITTTAGTRLAVHRIELRATALGTCYVRIATRLTGASAHELNQTLRRGSAHMGAERIRQGDAEWSRLGELAVELFAATGELLDAGRGVVSVIASVERRQHTVLSIRQLSVVDTTGHSRTVNYDQALASLGARLFDQRANHAAATLEEYVRTPARAPGTVVRDVGFEGEVIVRNPESTIVAMPSSPNFVVIYYDEIAEFSACLPALLDKWTAAISQQRRSLAAQLPGLDAVRTSERAHRASRFAMARQIGQLERQQTALRTMVTEAQSMLAFVKSPALCKTAKHRAVLDGLFEAAGIPLLEQDLEAQIAKVDALYLHVQALARELHEREQRRYRRLVEVSLAFLAVTSLAEFFGLFNDAIEDRALLLEVIAVLVVGAVVAQIVFRSFGRGRDG